MVRHLSCFTGGKTEGNVVSGTDQSTLPYRRLPAVSFKTIYRWIFAGRGTLQALRHKGKRQKPAENRGKFAIGRSISDRPQEVRSCETFGHWELGTVVSGRGKSKGCIDTLIERKTHLYTAILMPDRTALSMEIALGVAISQYPTGTFLIAMADRGKEFACYANLETSHDLHVYFADPYSSWQRGSNENANGLLSEFFPKGTDLAQVEDEDLASSLDLINYRPRKCLGWRTAHESFTEELSRLV